MAAVVDANVIIHLEARPDPELLTVPEVREELESQEAKRNFDVMEVQVYEPREDAVARVRERAEEIKAATSRTDEKLLALALERGAKLVTDDMDLQNLAAHLEAEFEPYMGDRIEKKLEWKRVCENCGHEFSGGKCSRCGSTRSRRKLDRYS